MKKPAKVIAEFKNYIEREVKMAESNKSYDGHDVVSRCYGALMFLFSLGLNIDELESWWDNEMRPRFDELERR